MIWLDNTSGHPRMGMIVPRFQFSAVARNRLRRRIREVWRREIRPTQPGYDLVVRARREAYAASFAAIQAELRGWREAVCR
jgi:ribonuclease P protein component